MSSATAVGWSLWLRRTQPFRSVYVTFQLAKLFTFHVPFWLIQSLVWRPRSAWSFGKTLKFKALRYVTCVWNSRIGTFTSAPVESITSLEDNLGPGVKAIWIEPCPDSFIREDVNTFAQKVDARPARIPGYWYYPHDASHHPIVTGIPKAKEGERVGLMLHGGGFLAQSAHPSDVSQNITRGILEHSSTLSRILSVEYRRMYGLDESTGPTASKNTFPVALLDTISGYYYLVHTLGFKPENIIVIGDSAGGNLTLALTRYLISISVERTYTPGGLILLSPWGDLGPSHHGPGSSFRRLAGTDFTGGMPQLEDSMLLGGRAYTHPFGDVFCRENPYVSPASKLLPADQLAAGKIFAGYPPTLIISGGAEVLLDSIHTLVEQMRRDLGEGKVQYLECEDAFHDFVMFTFAEPERTLTLRTIAEWLAKVK